MKEAADLRSKAKQKRRDRRRFDQTKREKLEGKSEKKPYNRKDWKEGKVD